jgi:arylformamidase
MTSTEEHDSFLPAHQQLSTLLGSMSIVDLSPLLSTNMPHWPTNPDVFIVGDARTYAQHGSFAQTLILPEHSGCHVDAPAHQHADQAEQTIDTFPVNALMGVAKKIDLSQEHYAPGDLVPLSRVKELVTTASMTLERNDIILFEFGWDNYLLDVEKKAPQERNWWGENEPGLDEDLCRYLSEVGVKAVGSDTAACDIAAVNGKITGGCSGHLTYFLPKGIFIIEGLHNLAQVPVTFYFMAFPLKIKGGSGSPLRPIALFPQV